MPANKHQSQRPVHTGALFCFCTLFILTACAGPRNYLNDNDRLRAEVMTLTEQRDALQTEVAALDKALEAEQRKHHANLPAGARIPVVARIELGKHSSLVRVEDTNIARLYLRTLDTKGRFTQIVGRAKVTIIATVSGEDGITLGTASIDETSLDAAYRSGLTGTHYTLTCPISDMPIPSIAFIHAMVTVEDLLHATSHKTQIVLD